MVSDNTRLWYDQYPVLTSGVELRHPFFDRRLVEFLLRIPATQKPEFSKRSKYVLRQAMAGTLPEVIRQRDGNTDYGFILLAGLKKHWSALRALFQDSRAAAAGYIDAPKFLKELEAKRVGGGKAYSADILATLGLEFWLREMEDL